MSSNAANPNNKDVIYIDVDDEITTIIDKVRSSGQKIVALVLPKRATVMQSIVNMKLLKRSADDAKKHIVLISGEIGLLPLAGVVGVHVAKSLQSKPEIPMVPAGMHPPVADDEDVPLAATASRAEKPLDRTLPVSEYAGAAALDNDVEEEAIEMTDDTPEPDATALTPAGAKKPKKDRKLAIPDFNRFRLILIGGGAALVALIIFLYCAIAVMPKATVLVKTDSEAIDTNMDVTLDTQATAADLDEAKLPAKQQQVQKSASETVPATGTLNKGAKAAGSVTITNCSDNTVTLYAGTGFSASGLTFISQKTVVVPASDLLPPISNPKCKKNGTATVDVTAQKGGSNYNLDAQSYTIAVSTSGLTASGSAMSGGTDNTVKVISQADVDGAKSKIAANDDDAIQFELQEALRKAGMYAMKDTFTTLDNPEVTTSADVGSEGDQVVVTQKTTFTMLGVTQDDLKKLIADKVKNKIDEDTQVILDYGLDDAVFEALDQQATATRVSMQVTTVAGSDLKVDELKTKVAGKKAGDAKAALKAYPGVTEVTVKYSPFWVSSIPKKTSKITLTIEKPQSKNDNN